MKDKDGPSHKNVIAGMLGLLLSGSAWATLQDEIQVYDDSINKPGQWGLEMHFNTTPSGISAREYPGEIQNVHGYRGTPEISYGLTETLEAGLYLPVVRAADGTTEFAGPLVRLKWIPRQAPATGGLFYGLNVEVSAVKPQYEQYQNAVELRPILGYRTPDWLFVTNPSLDYPLRAGYRQGGPDFDPSFKVSRNVTEGFATGFEYYSDLGSINNFLPFANQTHTLFLVVDVDRKPWVFNLGIGRGLTQASDRWTIKSIFEIPLD
ncbi:MAG: hypothetical protein ACYDCF_02310 [Burkholderiales bacterium]